MNHRDSSVGYVELFVRDAVPALRYFTGAFAFTARAFSEQPDRYSVLLASGTVRLVVTEPRDRRGAVAEWLRLHGDGVFDIALYRPDLDAVVQRARQAGLPILVAPVSNAANSIRYARIGGVGSLCHTLLADDPDGDWPPGFDWRSLRPIAEPIVDQAPPDLKSIHHVAIYPPAATLYEAVATYQSVFGMRIVRSEGAGVNSIVLRDAAGLTFAMSDPVAAVHSRSGVQHLAFLIDDLVSAVRGWRTRGVEFDGPHAAAYCWSGGVQYQMSTAYPHERVAMSFVLVERRGYFNRVRGGRCHVRSGH